MDRHASRSILYYILLCAIPHLTFPPLAPSLSCLFPCTTAAIFFPLPYMVPTALNYSASTETEQVGIFVLCGLYVGLMLIISWECVFSGLLSLLQLQLVCLPFSLLTILSFLPSPPCQLPMHLGSGTLLPSGPLLPHLLVRMTSR